MVVLRNFWNLEFLGDLDPGMSSLVGIGQNLDYRIGESRLKHQQNFWKK